MARYFDDHPSTWDDGPLLDSGLTPRPASEVIKDAAGGPAS